MCLFTSSVAFTVKCSLYIMDLMIKINHEQYGTVTGAVDFRGRRPKVWQEIKCYFCILAHILSNIESILMK